MIYIYIGLILKYYKLSLIYYNLNLKSFSIVYPYKSTFYALYEGRETGGFGGFFREIGGDGRNYCSFASADNNQLSLIITKQSNY